MVSDEIIVIHWTFIPTPLGTIGEGRLAAQSSTTDRHRTIKAVTIAFIFYFSFPELVKKNSPYDNNDFTKKPCAGAQELHSMTDFSQKSVQERFF